MGAKEFLKNRPAIEVVFWALLFTGELVPEFFYQPPFVAIMGTFIYIIPLIVAVHLGYYLYIHVRTKGYGWPLLIAGIVLLIIAAPLINYVIFNASFPDYRITRPILPYVLMKIPIATTIIGGVILILFTLDAWLEEVTKQANLKSEKLLSEIRALKSQINPHFLFNTLNNIYFYACSQHPNTPQMIEKLSEILRYLVYEGEKEWVSLKQEMVILENLIDLYKIKNSEQKNIQLTHTGVLAHHQIAPLILINLLENAFKHSDALSNPEGFIHVEARVDGQDQLHFHISNSVKPTSDQLSQNGVGQLNIEKQIELIYPEQFHLDTAFTTDTYDLRLTLPIFNATEYALQDTHR